jgi:hypothetical protein
MKLYVLANSNSAIVIPISLIGIILIIPLIGSLIWILRQNRRIKTIKMIMNELKENEKQNDASTGTTGHAASNMFNEIPSKFYR